MKTDKFIGIDKANEKSESVEFKGKRLVLSATIETEVSEEIVFKAWKQWMLEQFQNFRIEVSGKSETKRFDTKDIES